MFKDAQVVTSKFLQLKDKLNREISSHRGYNNSVMRANGMSEDILDLASIQRAFGELCELLHELTMAE